MKVSEFKKKYNKKRSKMDNVKCECDGIKFDSKREMEYYKRILKPLLEDNRITNLRIHEEIVLAPGIYYDDKTGEYILEDQIEGLKAKRKLKCIRQAWKFQPDFRFHVVVTKKFTGKINTKVPIEVVYQDIKPLFRDDRARKKYHATKAYKEFAKKKRAFKKIFGYDVKEVDYEF